MNILLGKMLQKNHMRCTKICDIYQINSVVEILLNMKNNLHYFVSVKKSV